MYITSKHLKIVKFLQGKDDIDFGIMGDFFDITVSNLNLSIREIYKYLDIDGSLRKMGEIVKYVQNHRGSLFLLKNEQHFRKRERRDFIIFSLLTKKIIKLNNIAENLEVSRRIINYDLEKVKIFLEQFNLEIASTNKGVELKGKKESRENLLYLFLFKFFLERRYLPRKSRILYYNFFKNYKLKETMNHLNYIIEIIGGKYTSYEKYAIYSFYLASISIKTSGKTLKDLKSFKEFTNILNLNLTENKLYNIYFILKRDDNLQKIPLRMLKKLKDLIIRIYPRNLYENEYYREMSLKIKNIIEKNYKVKISETEEFINRVVSWLEFCDYKEKLDISSSAFLQLNYIKISNEVMNTIGDIKKILPRFSIHDLTIIYFNSRDLFKDDIQKKRVVFVYKYIPKVILKHLKNIFKEEYNIKCDESIYISEFNKYRMENKVDLVIIVEDLKIDSVKTLKLDFPEF